VTRISLSAQVIKKYRRQSKPNLSQAEQYLYLQWDNKSRFVGEKFGEEDEVFIHNTAQ